jgi:hypothetical protein
MRQRAGIIITQIQVDLNEILLFEGNFDNSVKVMLAEECGGAKTKTQRCGVLELQLTEQSS